MLSNNAFSLCQRAFPVTRNSKEQGNGAEDKIKRDRKPNEIPTIRMLYKAPVVVCAPQKSVNSELS